MIFEGIISRIMPQSNNLDGVPVRLTRLSSLAVAQTEAPYSEKTRSGRRFAGGTQIIANGIAPVQAIPTTTATLGLFNSDTAGAGLSLSIDWLNVFLGSGTPAAGLTLFAAVAKPTSPPSANPTGYGTSSLSGSARGSKAIWGSALTIPAGVNWAAIASTLQLAAANAGQGDNFVDLGGRLIVPPGFALCLALLSGAGTTPLYGVSAQWSEVELDLE